MVQRNIAQIVESLLSGRRKRDRKCNLQEGGGETSLSYSVYKDSI
jgi:hypothetical protein